MGRLGIDIGGTKVALRTEGGSGSTYEHTFRWPDTRDPAVDLEMLTAAVRDAGRHTSVDSVGVAMPGTLDSTGRVIAWPSRAHWAGLGFVASLRDMLPAAEIRCADDGDLAAVAEADGAGTDSLLYLGIGTGVGAGLVLEGQPFPGFSRGSFEVGHIVVDSGGSRCVCGRRGCVQAVASGPAILGRATQLCGEAVDVERLREGLRSGSSWAESALDDSCAALATAITTVIELCRPGLVRIGGGFAAMVPEIVPRIALYTADLARPGQAPVQVESAACGPLSSLRGAVLFARST